MSDTAAIQELKRLRVQFTILSFDHDPNFGEIALQTAGGLSVDPRSLLKTLIIDSRNGPISALIPADRKLYFKALAQITGSKKLVLMDLKSAERLTGYTRGGISPVGQRRQLPTFIDQITREFPRVICSGGRPGIQLALCPIDLARACGGRFVDIGV